MRDKIVFFILGALLATLAYVAGDLAPLTAEDKIMELEELRVNLLRVEDSIVVGDIGKKMILIRTTNESAEITLYGDTIPDNRASFIDLLVNGGDKPSVSLAARDKGAGIVFKSHSERPEAQCFLGVASPEGKYQSHVVVKDLDGINSLSTTD